jgi:hypothetical protein
MRICVDENIPRETVSELEKLGHVVFDVRGTETDARDYSDKSHHLRRGVRDNVRIHVPAAHNDDRFDRYQFAGRVYLHTKGGHT